MEVQLREIQDLLEFFSKNTYKAKDTHPTFNHVMRRCLGLFGKDYVYSVIPNVNGELSTNYPSSLVILEKERGPNDADATDIFVEHGCDVAQDVFDLQSLEDELIGHHEQNGNGTSVSADSESSSSGTASGVTSKVVTPLDATKLKDLFGKARLARCRARFPVPVILYKSKHICRSATLSGGPEIYGRSSLDYFFSGNSDYRGMEADEDDEDIVPPENQSEWQLFDKVRSQDIKLLKSFHVQTIVDLMVEKKKVKFGVNVTSSEKVDKEKRYADFGLVSLPYPGCEFFKQYRDNDYNGKNLIFEWNQGHVDAEIYIPADPRATSLSINWGQYRNWDLICLTQNYLKLLLEYIRNGTSGLLIHCISGWDRTPLFVSLLRLSLWADGTIHKSLNAEQILYLTLAYDWLLFGHNLEDRLSKGEEILYFCFYFLKHITTEDFSVDGAQKDIQEESSPMSASAMLNARNDSDFQLEGVLLDGEACQASLNGSSWSLSSCDSSHSSRNLDAPPAYFTVGPADPSWDDPLGVSVCSNLGSLVNEFSISTLLPSSNGNVNHMNGKPKQVAGGGSPATISATIHKEVTEPQGITSYRQSAAQLIPTVNGNNRTSPVPVPRNGTQNRTDSNSSASIGSWQLITGLGSLRETVSSNSDPASAFSHISKTSFERMNSVVTESSCTLVDELTAATEPHTSLTGCVQEPDALVPAALADNLRKSHKNTHNATKGGKTSSKRRARLLAVSKNFDMAYAYAIKRPNRFNGVDGIVSTGLSGLIGNIANRVGIRATPRIVS